MKKDLLEVMTIGHSSRDWDEFQRLLQTYQVGTLVDVRALPRSRRNPQFNSEALSETLKLVEIFYRHIPALGGLRKPRSDSPNRGWRNSALRGFADYMQTPLFQSNLEELIALSQHSRIAIMCAETFPERCHRSLIADALVARKIAVRHILTENRASHHTLRDWVKVEGVQVLYPSPQGDLFS